MPAFDTKGFYNPAGLANFRAALAKAALGQGGVDVLLGPADSIGEGAKSAVWYTTLAYQIARRLQARFNPSSVRGGRGYQHWIGGTNNAGWGALSNATTGGVDGMSPNCFAEASTGWSAQRNQTNVTALRYLGNPSGTGRLRIDWPGWALQKQGVTDVELVFAQSSGGFQYEFFPTNGAFGTFGSGTGAGTLVGSGTYAPSGSRLLVGTGLDPTAVRSLQIARTGGTHIGEGLIQYCDDYGAGVRVHCMAHYGTTMTQWSTAGQYDISLGRFGSEPPTTTTAVGARRCGLVIDEIITNNASDSYATAVQQKQALVNYVRAMPSQPSLLFLIPPAYGNGASVPAYAAYAQAILDVANANKDVCCVANQWDALGRDLYVGTVASKGWAAADSLHYSAGWQNDTADWLMELLAPSATPLVIR